MLINPSFFKLNKAHLLLVFASLMFYISFAYDLERTDYVKLIMLYSALFFLFYKLIHLFKNNISFLTYLAFGFRAIFILAIPNLSQDFYRFIWDGRMILEGFNPYLFNVESFISNASFPVAQAQELYTFGTLYFGKKLLEKLNLPTYNIFWFILNPFIIIELTGNLHFEGVMIFFLVWSIYLLKIGKWSWAAMVLALSISTKLIPLIFLPLFFQWFMKHNDKKEISTALNNIKWIPAFAGMTKLVRFYGIVGITTALLFLPFYSSEFINNYTQTVALWFQKFEFNASLYYIAREIGYAFRGYNEIAIIGKILALLVVLFTLSISLFRKNKSTVELITAMLLVLSFYYFTTTTLHPWYITTLLILSVFTKYKFPLVWSFIIILSYLAYININKQDKSENLWIIGLEYIIVYGVFIWDVFYKKQLNKKPIKLS